LETSHFFQIPFPPFATIVSKVCLAFSSLKSIIHTKAPFWAKTSEIAFPIPLPPPVIIAVLFFKLNKKNI